MFFIGNGKLPQANWFFQRDSSICLRLFTFDSVITHFPYAIGCRRADSSVLLRLFLVSRIEEIHFLKLWSIDELILPSAWGFFSYHVLKGYISWSHGASMIWFFHTLKAFSRITYWRDTFLEAMERRRLGSSVRLRLFLVSHIEEIHFLKRWSVDDLILLSAWGFFSYHILKEYISWSYGASTTWFFCPPEAFFCITYWRDTFLESIMRRRLDSSVRLRLFLVSRIEGIRIRRRMGVRWRRCAVTWD